MNGDKGLVRFSFMYSPEYLKTGEIVLFREGRTKILGEITRVLSEEEEEHEKTSEEIINENISKKELIE